MNRKLAIPFPPGPRQNFKSLRRDLVDCNVHNLLVLRWTEANFETLGNFPGGHGSIYDGKERKKVSMKAKEALERLQHVGNHQPVLAADERYYIYQYDSKPFSPLIDQISSKTLEYDTTNMICINPNYCIDSPSTLIPVLEVFSNVWISSADSLTPAHYDKADNLLLQLNGTFNIFDVVKYLLSHY